MSVPFCLTQGSDFRSPKVRFEPLYDYPQPIPAELTARWQHLPADTVVVADLVRLLVRAATIITAVAGAVFLTRSLPVGLLLWCAVPAGFALSALISRRWISRFRVTPAQIDMVLAHRVEVRQHLDDASLLALSADTGALPASDGADLFPERQLVARAQATCAQILASPAGDTDDLISAHLPIDPAEQLRQVRVSASHLAEFRDQIGVEPEATDETLNGQLRAEWNALHDQLTGAVQALAARVEALDGYLASMRPLESWIKDQRRLTELRAAADRTGFDIARRTALEQMAAAEVAARARDIRPGM